MHFTGRTRYTRAEQFHCFGALDRREVLIELADGKEIRGQQADDFVAVAMDLRKPIGGGDGHGDDQLVGPLRVDLLQGGDHGRAGSNPIVGQNHRPALDRCWRTHIAIQLLAPRDLVELVASLLG